MESEKKKSVYYTQGVLSGALLLITWLIISLFHENGPKQPVDFLLPSNFISDFGWSLLYAMFFASIVGSFLNGVVLIFIHGPQMYKVLAALLLVVGAVAALQAPSLITFRQTIEYFNLFS